MASEGRQAMTAQHSSHSKHTNHSSYSSYSKHSNHNSITPHGNACTFTRLNAAAAP